MESAVKVRKFVREWYVLELRAGIKHIAEQNPTNAVVNPAQVAPYGHDNVGVPIEHQGLQIQITVTEVDLGMPDLPSARARRAEHMKLNLDLREPVDLQLRQGGVVPAAAQDAHVQALQPAQVLVGVAKGPPLNMAQNSGKVP